MPVGLQAGRLLECLDGGLGAGAERAVRLAVEMAGLVQPLLDVADGVAVEHYRLIAVADLHPIRGGLDPRSAPAACGSAR